MGITEVVRALDIALKSDRANWFAPVSEDMIAAAEDYLAVRFPPSYREFVSRVGFLGIGPREFYGVTKSGLSAAAIPSIIFATQSARKTGGLPKGLLLIENSGGEEVFVIDARSTTAGEEAPVRVWMPAFHDSLELPEIATDFGSYLLAAVEAEQDS
jgi:hypothetical protein